MPQEKDLIRLKREAKAKGGFYVEPEAKLAFVVRIRGINDMHPKTRKILQLLRLRQIHNGVFIRVSCHFLTGPAVLCHWHGWCPVFQVNIGLHDRLIFGLTYCKDARIILSKTHPLYADEQGDDQHASPCGTLHHMGLSQPEDSEGADLQAWLWQGVHAQEFRRVGLDSKADQLRGHAVFSIVTKCRSLQYDDREFIVRCAPAGQQVPHPLDRQLRH